MISERTKPTKCTFFPISYTSTNIRYPHAGRFQYSTSARVKYFRDPWLVGKAALKLYTAAGYKYNNNDVAAKCRCKPDDGSYMRACRKARFHSRSTQVPSCHLEVHNQTLSILYHSCTEHKRLQGPFTLLQLLQLIRTQECCPRLPVIERLEVTRYTGMFTGQQ